MMKKYIIVAVLIALAFVWAISRGILISTGALHKGYIQGFAVDSEGNYYIGQWEKIEVFNGTEQIRAFSPQTSRSYTFVIKDDKLFIAYSFDSSLEEYDLYGNFISESRESYGDVVNAGRKSINMKFEQNGNVYEIKDYHQFKPYEIFINGELVYKMSTLDFLYYGVPYYIWFSVEFIMISIMAIIFVGEKFNKKVAGA